MMKNKVLLVEDNKADAVLVQLALEETGLQLELEHLIDGESMLNRLERTNSDNISFILLDLNIPKANGPEILQVRKLLPNWNMIPVVVYSSSTRQEDISACLAAGANAYICKQIDFELFTQNMQATIRFWHEIALRS
jgi:CheY-like chemotaxis protein